MPARRRLGAYQQRIVGAQIALGIINGGNFAEPQTAAGDLRVGVLLDPIGANDKSLHWTALRQIQAVFADGNDA